MKITRTFKLIAVMFALPHCMLRHLPSRMLNHRSRKRMFP